MNKDTSGQAFPTMERGGGGLDLADPGMTLRDYFAAKAMQSLIVDPERFDQSREECARLSYLMADAMMAARALPQGEKHV